MSRLMLVLTSKNSDEKEALRIFQQEGDLCEEDVFGTSALEWAAARGYQDLCRKLLEAGADKSRMDEKGLTVLDYARTMGFTELAEFIDHFPASRWIKCDGDSIAEVSRDRSTNMTIRHVFNFRAREKTVIVENDKTGLIGVSPSVSFDDLTAERLQQAVDAFRICAPGYDMSNVFGPRHGGFSLPRK